MLTNYLPQLPAKQKIGGKVLAPPSALRTVLDSGIQTRNTIAHRPVAGESLSTELDTTAVVNLLDAVSDILWLLDYYCGQKWALDYLSENTGAALGI